MANCVIFALPYIGDMPLCDTSNFLFDAATNKSVVQHRLAVKERTLSQGWKSIPDWLFPNINKGSYLNYGNFMYRVWNKAMEKSELRRRTPHDMRHTYAALRVMKGDPLAEVAKEMEHAHLQ